MDDSSDWGRLYVNRRCCGAATCRNLAPELLGEVPTPEGLDARGPAVLPGSYAPGAFTGVLRQPRDREEFLAARAAAAACAFGAIEIERPRALSPHDRLAAPWADWPRRIEENVWVLGHPSPRSVGALSYFIERPEGGVLVDLPKPDEALWAWLEAHGGVRWVFVTHRDNAQHLEELRARFPACQGIIGAADVNAKASAYFSVTSGLEVRLDAAAGPWRLDGSPLAEDARAGAEFVILPQPGHTPGTLCLLYRGRFLFTGDHLSHSRRLGHLVAHRLQCWFDWDLQCASVGRLVTWAEAGWLRFTWILPAHGDWHRVEGQGDAATTAARLREGLAWMRRQPSGKVSLLRFVSYVATRKAPEGRLARVMRALGGEGGEALLLPAPVRRYLSHPTPARARAAARRLLAVGCLVLVTASGLTWLGVRLVGSLGVRP
ncbi:hypothetical protein [Melittangium boletus]|uniref:hypothetical protein n=1 Tax=Melittangium boletus TaxID=83453 RepID=UPI003DA3371A